MPQISVIIPTLNEANFLPHLLEHLKSMLEPLEIIVVDGGSTDETLSIARCHASVLEVSRGRASQMNAGASLAGGDVFWFLHADCFPHADSAKAILQALKNPEVVGGAFEYRLDHPGFLFRITEFFSNRKNKILKLLYGDMGIFVRRETFFRIGGFPEIPLMEDMEFCRSLKREGTIVILPQPMRTSARRWVEEGPIKNMVRNWLLQIAWKLGASPTKLSRWYRFQ